MKLTRALVKGRERRKERERKGVSGGVGNVTNSEGSQ